MLNSYNTLVFYFLIQQYCKFEFHLTFNLGQNKIHESIGIAEELGIIQRTIRKFSNLKTLSFISLKLEIISYECISWVIKSLKIDDMTPSEKAIQSRVKEAFALRIQT